MTYNNRLIKKLNLSGKGAGSGKRTDDADIMDMMTDPRYLRQSSALINEALQKGFDVLQLADGDIVTTGTKTVVYQYTWDAEKGKLVKTKSESSKKSPRRQVMDDDEDEIENETEEA